MVAKAKVNEYDRVFLTDVKGVSTEHGSTCPRVTMGVEQCHCDTPPAPETPLSGTTP